MEITLRIHHDLYNRFLEHNHNRVNSRRLFIGVSFNDV